MYSSFSGSIVLFKKTWEKLNRTKLPKYNRSVEPFKKTPNFNWSETSKINQVFKTSKPMDFSTENSGFFWGFRSFPEFVYTTRVNETDRQCNTASYLKSYVYIKYLHKYTVPYMSTYMMYIHRLKMEKSLRENSPMYPPKGIQTLLLQLCRFHCRT